MPNTLPEYELIEEQGALARFYELHKAASWIAFDTEFVGEKRYYTTLCLIQVASEKGVFLIDPFSVKDLSPFFSLITSPDIVKVTHAGDNDYRLLFNHYGLTPKNIFDTQVAAGFVGYNYPTSFGKLVEGELGVRLKKGYAVTDWESRPLKTRQLGYAINDVIYLEGLWQRLHEKLVARGREAWAKEEFSILESASFYERQPHAEAINSKLMHALKRKEKVFLIRLFEWRQKLAEKRNHSKDMVLASKYINQIVRGISSGKEALVQNRRIPSKLIARNGATFEELYHAEITEEEQELLKKIPSEVDEDPQEKVVIEMLYQVIKYKCMAEEMSINMVLPRNILKKIRANDNDAYHLLGDSWRKEWLGAYFVDWLANAKSLDLQLLEDKIVLIPK
jgi:ribonuclease D